MPRAVVLACACAVARGLAPARAPLARRRWSCRNPTVRMDYVTARVPAKALPSIFGGAGALLLARAATTTAAGRPERAVLVAAAALAAIDLGPTARTQVVSSRRAMRITDPEGSGAAFAKRRAAEAWRGAVRAKVVGQLVGLATMARYVYRGAAVVLAANLVFWAAGAGANRHDATGARTPVPPGLVRVIVSIDAGIAASAFAASQAPPGSPTRTAASCAVVAGMAFGIAEKLPGVVRRARTPKS